MDKCGEGREKGERREKGGTGDKVQGKASRK